MIAVWKFPLRLEPGVLLPVIMPAGAQILTAQMQAGKLVFWARVDTGAENQTRFLCVVTTGRADLDQIKMNTAVYIATVQIVGEIGTLVFHIFEVDPPLGLKPIRRFAEMEIATQ
jgi:hypothetical protein